MAYRLPFSDPSAIDSTRAFPVTGLFSDPGVISSQRPTTVWSQIGAEREFVAVGITLLEAP